MAAEPLFSNSAVAMPKASSVAATTARIMAGTGTGTGSGGSNSKSSAPAPLTPEAAAALAAAEAKKATIAKELANLQRLLKERFVAAQKCMISI